MFEVEVVEVHRRAPRRKRERDGLSAEGAYDAMALDTSNVGIRKRKAMDDHGPMACG